MKPNGARYEVSLLPLPCSSTKTISAMTFPFLKLLVFQKFPYSLRFRTFFFFLFYVKDERTIFYDITCGNVISKIPMRVKSFEIQLLLFNSP